MRLRYLLLFGLVIMTGCSKVSLAELETPQEKQENKKADVAKVQEDETKDPVKKAATDEARAEEVKPEIKAEKKAEEKVADAPPAKTKAEIEADKKAADEIAAKNRIKDGMAKLKELNAEYTKATTAWRNSLRGASPEEREELMKETPQSSFGEKFVKLADEFAGTKVATSALTTALTKGSGEAKTAASTRLLELAQMDSGTIESKSILLSLARSGQGKAKITATETLVDTAAKDLSGIGEATLTQVIKLRGESEAKTKAANLMLGLADKDIRSNKAFDQLSTIATSTTGAMKAKALERITEHHANNDKLVAMMKSMGRAMPEQATEDWLKSICRKSTSDKIKGNAAVALNSFVGRRNMYRDFYADADESVLKNVDKDLLAYLNKEVDPNEGEMIETVLDTYVKDNEKLVAEVKKQLFVVQNLSIGKTAPEIAAVDLDGVDFKLSDYRGKIVFLDFWGDW